MFSGYARVITENDGLPTGRDAGSQISTSTAWKTERRPGPAAVESIPQKKADTDIFLIFLHYNRLVNNPIKVMIIH